MSDEDGYDASSANSFAGSGAHITIVSKGPVWSWTREDLQAEFNPDGVPPELKCRVYWGSHGCHRHRHHLGPHRCCEDGDPYYGWLTNFYGEDAPWYSKWIHRPWLYRIREPLRRWRMRRLVR